MLIVKRRVHDQGGSLVLVLPKVWTESNGLGPDDLVEIRLNDKLTITPVKEGDRAE